MARLIQLREAAVGILDAERAVRAHKPVCRRVVGVAKLEDASVKIDGIGKLNANLDNILGHAIEMADGTRFCTCQNIHHRTVGAKRGFRVSGTVIHFPTGLDALFRRIHRGGYGKPESLFGRCADRCIDLHPAFRKRNPGKDFVKLRHRHGAAGRDLSRTIHTDKNPGAAERQSLGITVGG